MEGGRRAQNGDRDWQSIVRSAKPTRLKPTVALLITATRRLQSAIDDTTQLQRAAKCLLDTVDGKQVACDAQTLEPIQSH